MAMPIATCIVIPLSLLTATISTHSCSFSHSLSLSRVTGELQSLHAIFYFKSTRSLSDKLAQDFMVLLA